MITICGGMVRSGSTWAYNVCRILSQVTAAQLRQPFAATFLSGLKLDSFLSTMTSPVVAVIKSHELGPVTLDWIRTGRARAICTIRDPRDCVASDLSFLKGAFDATVARVQHGLKYLQHFETYGRTLFIRYEEMMANPASQIMRIAPHLGINIGPEGIKAVDAATNMQASEKICQDLKNRPADLVATVADHLVDRSTQLHDNHLQGGKIGKWKDELTPEQAKKLNQLFEPWLLTLGYETQQTLHRQPT